MKNEIIVILVGFFSIISIVSLSLQLGISPTPISRRGKKGLLASLPSLQTGKVIELGSGWGGLLHSLARHYPHLHVEGIELSPIPWLISRLRFPHLSIKRKNFLQHSWNDASLLVCYLSPKHMEEIARKIEKEGYKGLILSYCFSLPHQKESMKSYAEDLYQTPIYLYSLNIERYQP